MIAVRTEAVPPDNGFYGQGLVEVVVESEEGDHTWGVFHPEVAEAEAKRLRDMFAVVTGATP